MLERWKLLTIPQMIKMSGFDLAYLSGAIMDMAIGFDDGASSPTTIEEARTNFIKIIDICTTLEWEDLTAQAERLRAKAIGGQRGHAMYALTVDLRDAILDRIQRDAVLVIPASRIKYYDQKLPLFGKKVFDEIPEAAQEISEAGKCFALDRWTACIFHLMRSLELSLHRIAKELGISFPAPIELQDWKTLVDKIDKQIEMLENQSRSLQKTEDLRFYSTLNLEFGWFKNAWRNHISHARESYNEEQAANIMDHVGKFLNEVANRPII